MHATQIADCNCLINIINKKNAINGVDTRNPALLGSGYLYYNIIRGWRAFSNVSNGIYIIRIDFVCLLNVVSVHTIYTQVFDRPKT